MFSYCSHLNTTTNLNGIFGDVNFSVNENREILLKMYVHFKRYLLENQNYNYFNILLYIAILYLPLIPVNLLKNAPINIAMLIFTNILETHCLKVANMYEHKYQY